MSKNLRVPLAVSLLFLAPAYIQSNGDAYSQVVGSNAFAQENVASRICADVPGQTSGTRRFQRLGETIEISLRRDVKAADGTPEGDGRTPASRVDCEPVALDLHWSNGRNNGSNFNLTFLDSTNKPIYTKSFSGFLAGNLEFDLSSSDFRRVYASSMTVFSVPAVVRIQAVSPFAAPVSLSYTVTRVARPAKTSRNEEDGIRVNGESLSAAEEEPEAVGSRVKQDASEGNQVVSIRDVVRLIGASKLPVVQIELKTAHPFPIKAVPLQLQIGKQVFVDELSGDYTGRKLTLSLTPEMFAELHDGDEIVASFGKREATEGKVWYFGKLVKKGE
jgi:hypothetical protein